MIKKLLLPLLLFIVTSTNAQLNNSWIDYSKTYYKFKIAADNICRIPQATLTAVGIGSANADHFQLWRNGKQVRLFTSVLAAPLGVSDYIEFWGEMNDGKPDATLYRQPQFQLADRYSLETDTAVYFLTINTTGGNLRYANAVNNSPSAATPDAFFMRKIDLYFKDQVCRGYANNCCGTPIYSSAYENGEGLTSSDIVVGTPRTIDIPDLNVYTAAPPTSLLSVRAKMYSTTPGISRTITTKVFNTVVDIQNTQSFSDLFGQTLVSQLSLPLTYLQNTTNVPITIANTNPSDPTATDRLVIASLGITYPAVYNFNNAKSFVFELAAAGGGNYLVIDNFNFGSVAPVLYDESTARRYVGDIVSTPGKVKFLLPASSAPTRKFILNSVEPTAINTVVNITTKNFVDYNTAANRGDYIIISSPVLYNDGSGVNNVEAYRAYRASANGGGYNAKVCDINELTDQFAFGIKSHPAAVRDFVRFMDVQYPVKPKSIFIIGRGVSYYDKKFQESNPLTKQIDFVPTFGWPPSDVLLVSQPTTAMPVTPIGRLGAINGTEVGYYYQKVLQYEDAQRTQSPLINDKAWMKNTMQIIGGKTDGESNTFKGYMNGYADIIKDTLFGGRVEQFIKTSSATVQQASSDRIAQLFQEGLGFVGYFGHSSASTFEFNLSDPTIYNNVGKYPFFNASGCTAGNYYNFDPSRLAGPVTLSDKYVLANQKGSIGFLADTHFGVDSYLNQYNIKFHLDFAKLLYGKTVGEQLKDVALNLGGLNSNLDYVSRMHLEEINLHGDPAIKINNFPKPDYVIERQNVKISPSIITVADPIFNVKIEMRNIGRATNDSMRVYVKRLIPNTTTPTTIIDTMIFATRNTDSLNLNIPINPATDKGQNQLIIELDHTNRVSEIYETNNKITVDFFIFENTLNPVYPYNYSIVNAQNITFTASTANPLIGLNNYVMELDTTELFNSAFKKTYTKTSVGGAIEFAPTNVVFTDSTVYYWRTAVVPATGSNIWNSFSFVYLPNSSAGFNQSHYYQNTKSIITQMTNTLDNTWKFDTYNSFLKLKNGVFPTAANQAEDFGVDIDNVQNIQSACGTSKIIINAINPIEMEPIFNNIAGGVGQYNSENICGAGREYNFQYNGNSQTSRNFARDFLDLIPQGYYVTIRYTSASAVASNVYANVWQADGANSFYSRMVSAGFTNIDSFNRPRAFNFIYRKGVNSFNPVSKFSDGITDKIQLDVTCPSQKGTGTITSPVFGPARSWDTFRWRGKSSELATGDSISFKVVGITNSGVENTLFTVDSTIKDFNISSINATQYPFIRLKMFNQDKKSGTPYQLRYWRLNYTAMPEGAVAPNILFTMKDTVEAGEPINFSVAFKNISATSFASAMKINMRIKTNNNVDNIITIPAGKILVSGDTLKASYTIPSENYIGNNNLFIDFNPSNDQPEQTHFNNILYKDFYVKSDKENPLLDVTFDGVHILNRDIVASKPDILIKLKDESKFLPFRMQDTGLIKVQLRYPNQTLRTFYFNNDTMRFTPANLASGENAATINLKPYLTEDGDYELIVTGKDRSGNGAGALDYHTVFTVINKAMISELLNYPNPFTTSTAFVFTLTGTEIPQNMRIQILTITGKIVREITKAELGPIHVGRNITDFKWDGTDMYGQALANGVYIYRVITNLNGKSLEKYKADGDNTDKYFNKGYGKMYLMR
jgi:Peptidase family C25